MSVLPVFVDSRPDYFRDSQLSLLQLPRGTGTFLEYLHASLGSADIGEASILALFPTDAEYEARVRALLPNVQRVVGDGRLESLVNESEPSDGLLFVDPAQFPRAGYLRHDLQQLVNDPHPVKHMVAVDTASDCAQERVLLDPQGRVRRIQRYYAGVTWVDACVVSYSLVSGAAGRVLADESIRSLSDLRRMLMARGISSQDSFLDEGAFDLNLEYGLLHLNDLIVAEVCGDQRAHRRARLNGNGHAGHNGTGQWRASDCRVASTARLHGPCILQAGVSVGENALIIGPTVIGAGAEVGRDTVLAQCVVAPQTVIPDGSQLRHRVLIPRAPHAVAQVCPMSSPATALRESLISEAAPTRGAATSQLGTRVFILAKRCADVTLATLGLVLLAPLLAAAAAAVKITSRGPIFFGHERESVGGRPFKCWKFRTMVSNAHVLQRELYKQNKVDGPQFKMSHDPRITTVGRMLRNSNIDELPQLYNVLRGDMSLIGPRPSPFRENQICVPWRQARLSVQPGITGLWQVCRSQRDTGDFHQWIYFDTLYVRHMSIALDLKILLATIFTAGGRWSVPVEWLIPRRQLLTERPSVLPTRAPVLSQGRLAQTTEPVARGS